MKVRVFISGRVQGVFFRVFIKNKAEELGLTGWARNLTDGRVEAVFIGPRSKVEEMIKWCWKGSAGSQAEKVTTSSFEKKEEKRKEKEEISKGFEIRY